MTSPPHPQPQQRAPAKPPLPDPFYPDPDWACLPPPDHDWTLTEIKSGVEIQKVQLHTRPCWLMGRAADQVHIPLNHESISRCHARMAFDSSGILWLKDCKSTHGTVVNKKKLPPLAIGTTETNSTKPGSRGVVVYPGDVLQFGASTRLYCIEGPEEFQRGAVKLVLPISAAKQKQQQQLALQAAQHQQQQAPELLEPNSDPNFVSWGISMDDEVDAGASSEQAETERMARQQALEDGTNIPEKHRKAWEKIAALKYKLKNVLLESERIRKKGDLTQGQEHQLKRNQEREQQIQEKIEEREQELFEKLYPEQAKSHTKSKKRSRHHGPVDSDEDVDDFFDRTKDNHHNNKDTGDGETEESLLAKWDQLKSLLQRKEVAVERAQQKVSTIQQRYDRLQSVGDDEAFFVQNDLTLAQEQLRKLEQEREQVVKDMQETKTLLHIVNPKIQLEEERSKEDVESSMAPPPGRKIIVTDANDTASAVMPPPPPPPPSMPKPSSNTTATQTQPPASNSANGEKSSDFMMPPPKRIRTASSTEQPQPQTTSTDDKKKPVPSVKGPAKGPTRGPLKGPSMGGTLAALKSVASDSGASSSNHDRNNGGDKKVSSSSDAATQHTKNPPTISLKNLEEDTWQAPKDQDGSGYTKLNEKFAGRY